MTSIFRYPSARRIQPAGATDRPQPPGSRHWLTLPSLLALGLAMAGCSTPNVNPPSPRANTGYVDFYTDSDLDLSWEIKCAGQSGEMQTVFSEFKPVQGNILRLAAPPGTRQFQVWVMNQVTQGPQGVQAQIESAKITPVHVTFKTAGTNTVDRKVFGFRPSAKGYGRGTKIVSDQNEVLQIGAVAGAPLAYQPKERMPYFSAAQVNKP
jgi:hypothetical protein